MDDLELRALLLAQTAQIQALTTALGSRVSPVPSLTFGQLWGEYWHTIKHLGWAHHARDLMVAPLAHFRDRKVMELRRPDWTFYRDEVRSKQTTRLGSAPAVGTRNLELKRVRAMFNWAVAEEKIPSNPFANVKPETPRPPRETTIPDDGLERLFEVSDPMLWAFIIVGVDSGMREEEVRWLTRAAIRPGGKIAVSWTAAKTKRSRSVRLSARAIEAIERLPIALSGFVFANPDTGEPYSRTWFWERWRAAVDDAGLEAAPGDVRVHYHDTRHTFVSRTIEAGTPIAIAMRASGHITLSQINRYLHLEEGALDEMQARNDARIARRGPHRAPTPEDALRPNRQRS